MSTVTLDHPDSSADWARATLDRVVQNACRNIAREALELFK